MIPPDDWVCDGVDPLEVVLVPAVVGVEVALEVVEVVGVTVVEGTKVAPGSLTVVPPP